MKAKKSGGMKNKLYCKRSQGDRYMIFQVISTVVRIYVFPFTDISKRMVSNVCAGCEELFQHQKRNIVVHIFFNYWDLYLLKLWRCYSSTKNSKKQQQRDGNPCFIFTIIFVHNIIVMIDDAFGCNTCLALCQHASFKGL